MSREISRGVCKMAWTLTDIKKKKKKGTFKLAHVSTTGTCHTLGVQIKYEPNFC